MSRPWSSFPEEDGQDLPIIRIVADSFVRLPAFPSAILLHDASRADLSFVVAGRDSVWNLSDGGNYARRRSQHASIANDAKRYPELCCNHGAGWTCGGL